MATGLNKLFWIYYGKGSELCRSLLAMEWKMTLGSSAEMAYTGCFRWKLIIEYSSAEYDDMDAGKTTFTALWFAMLFYKESGGACFLIAMVRFWTGKRGCAVSNCRFVIWICIVPLSKIFDMELMTSFKSGSLSLIFDRFLRRLFYGWTGTQSTE